MGLGGGAKFGGVDIEAISLKLYVQYNILIYVIVLSVTGSKFC